MKLQSELSKFQEAFNSVFASVNVQSYVDKIKASGEYKDLKTRIVWDLFWYSINQGFLTHDYIDYLRKTYGVNDSHIDTILKKAIDNFNLEF